MSPFLPAEMLKTVVLLHSLSTEIFKFIQKRRTWESSFWLHVSPPLSCSLYCPVFCLTHVSSDLKGRKASFPHEKPLRFCRSVTYWSIILTISVLCLWGGSQKPGSLCWFCAFPTEMVTFADSPFMCSDCISRTKVCFGCVTLADVLS